MSRRNLTIFTVSKSSILTNISRSVIIRFNNKLKIKLLKCNNKIFVKPRDINYTNYIHKRHYCCSVGDNYNRHKYPSKVENLINEQINLEYVAAFTYLTIASYFGRSNVGLPGIFGFYMKMYKEECEHAVEFIKYQNMRGGIVLLSPVIPPKDIEFSQISTSFAEALKLEKIVKEKLQLVQTVATKFQDSNCVDMLDAYIADQEKTIYEISHLYTRISEVEDTDLGKYIFDKELYNIYVQNRDKDKFVYPTKIKKKE